MTCETCVEMTQTTESLLQEMFRIKRTNKILRTINGMLRRQESRDREHMDAVFLALCDTDKAAEIAMGELWGSGAFDCGPQDYDYMIEACLAAVSEQQAQRRADPSQTFHADRDFGDESGHVAD